MTQDTNELHLFLGRVEGKLDAALLSQAALANRLALLEASNIAQGQRIVRIETIAKTRSSFSHTLVAFGLSIVAILVGLYGHIKDMLH